MPTETGRIKMSARKIPITEIFGPTIQGEGPEQGRSCYFVRTGGCDYKCEWCDTPHAVLPGLVRNNQRLTPVEMLAQLKSLAKGPDTVVISGGNPLLHDLDELVGLLQGWHLRVTVETQGTLFKKWLYSVDYTVMSPKPPSSGMVHESNTFNRFIDKLSPSKSCLKIVVFDQQDYLWATMMHRYYSQWPMFLSAGNDAGATVGNPGRVDTRTQDQVVSDLTTKGRWLANRVMVDPEMHDVRVQVQQHVLYWGNERGR